MATEPRSTTAPGVDGELMPQRSVLEDEISAGADRSEECCDKQTEVAHRRASRGSPILCYLRTELHLSGFAVPREEAPDQSRSEDEAPSADGCSEPSGHTSFAGSRYQVRELLGEGSKKRVHLAHHELIDRDVAFALIKTDGLDEVGRERIAREAQAMGRLAGC